MPVLGHLEAVKLDAIAVRRLHEAIARKGLSARTQQSAHVTLSAALQHALRQGLVDRNVARQVRPPRPVRDPARVHAMPAQVIDRILRATLNEPLHALWVVLATTGLRKGEALALRWSDVDMDAGILRVERSLYRRREGGLGFKPPKTDKGRRALPIPAMTVDALRGHRSRQAYNRLVAGQEWTDHDLVSADC